MISENKVLEEFAKHDYFEISWRQETWQGEPVITILINEATVKI